MLRNVQIWSNGTFQGLVYKKGKFSAIEEEQLTAAIRNYQTVYKPFMLLTEKMYSGRPQEKALNDEELMEIIFSKNDKNKDNAFWMELSMYITFQCFTVLICISRVCTPTTHHCGVPPCTT